MAKADIKALRNKFAALRNERAPHEEEWKDLRDLILPECGNFNMNRKFHQDPARWEKIIDACATDAAEVLAAGMLGGMTSPARPWFQLTTNSPELDEQYEVKKWLADVSSQMLMIFAASNVYEALHKAYLELGVFGTACLVVLPSPRSIVHVEPLTVGEYWLAEDAEGRINTLYRVLYMTAAQMVERFGRSAVSSTVLKSYDNNKRFERFTVIHAIEPRDNYNPDKVDAQNMPWRSVYFEENSNDHEGSGILLEEGFTHFPGLCPRWLVKGANVYGVGPGSKALPGVKALQGMHTDLAYGVGYMARPPLQVPAELEGRENDWSPGGIVYVANANANQSIQPAMNVQFNVQHLDGLLNRLENKIENFFFKDLFLLITNTSRNDRTAYEVEQLEKEKMMLMGPVLERLHTELLGPLINATFDYMCRAGQVPPIPESLEGNELTVSYISILALAQKATSLNGYDRIINTIAAVQSVLPQSNVGDLFDSDLYLRKVADMLGLDPDVLRSGEHVAEIRDMRNQQIEQQQQLQQAQQAASAVKDLSAGAQQAGSLQSLQGY